MIANEEPLVADSLWTATAGVLPDYPALRGPAETDVAIIGGGYTGLSAALHLAETGVATTLLEAETPGWGASGRNGGQVNPGLKVNPDEITAQLGAPLAERVIRLSGDAPDLVFDLIERHAIDCAAERKGWITTGINPSMKGGLETRVSQWKRRGAPIRMLSRAETEAALATDAYGFSVLDERGGTLHPLDYATGLARAASSTGAVLHGHSRVTAIVPERDGYLLTSAKGQLRARRVLVCTNAYTDELAAPLGRTLVPVRSMQVATAPLSNNLRHSILPGRQAVSDGRRLVLYFRMDPDGRFVMGGRGSYTRGATRRRLDELRRAAVDLYPQLVDVNWQHAWGGFVAMTADHVPHLNRLAPGMVAAAGYNGRGVAMATAMGRVLSDWAAGRPEAELDFPVTEPHPVPFHGLRKPAVSALVAWYGILDRLGIR